MQDCAKKKTQKTDCLKVVGDKKEKGHSTGFFFLLLAMKQYMSYSNMLAAALI